MIREVVFSPVHTQNVLYSSHHITVLLDMKDHFYVIKIILEKHSLQ